MKKISFLLFTLLLNIKANAEFISIKASEVNVREGPGKQYAILWKFIKKNEPVKVIRRYNSWILIEDYEGDSGWVNSSLISSKNKFVIIKSNNTEMFNKPDPKSTIIAKIAATVRCNLLECKKNFCKINCKECSGWVNEKFIWGN